MTATSLRTDSTAAASPAPRPRWQQALLLAVTVALVIPPFVLTPIALNRLSRLVVLAIAVLAVNLLTGYTGLVSLGHGVFVGIGAFAVANFIETGIPVFPAAILATALTGALGLVLGFPALRIRGVHLAIVTFGLALAFGPVSRRVPRWTGGSTGITVDNSGFAAPAWTGVSDAVWGYVISLIVVGAWLLVARNLINSRSGRAMRTIRDHETAASSFGVPLVRTKAGALTVSAAMAGSAGVMQALINPFVSNGDFDAFLSLRLYAAAVVGGLGTLLGSVFGVIALIAVPAFNDLIGIIESDAIVFGLGLLLISLVAPDGIAGWLQRRRSSAGNS